jgi:hypothetical protein
LRRFWLKKGAAIWDLSASGLGNGNGFFGSPEGLGVKTKIETYEAERACFIESVKLETQEISGKLYFKDYAAFTTFTDFIGYVENPEPLRLYYSTGETPPNYQSDSEWYKLVLIKELKKGEISEKSGVLECAVKFQSVSRWKKDQTITLELTPFGEPLVYPYIYPYFYGGMNNVAAVINNTGNLPAHCTVKAEAETDTPVFRVIQNGEVVEQAKYNVYIRPKSYLIVNSDPANQEASIYTDIDGGGVHREDVYYLGERDYAYSNFLTIPSGESMFLFSAKNSKFGRVTLQFSLTKELI